MINLLLSSKKKKIFLQSVLILFIMNTYAVLSEISPKYSECPCMEQNLPVVSTLLPT